MLGKRFPQLQSFIKNKWDSKWTCRQPLKIWLKENSAPNNTKLQKCVLSKSQFIELKFLRACRSPRLWEHKHRTCFSIFKHSGSGVDTAIRERGAVLGSLRVLLKVHVNLHVHCEKHGNINLDRSEHQPGHRNHKVLLSSHLQGGLSRSFYSHQTAVCILSILTELFLLDCL